MTGYESKKKAAQDKLAQPAQEPVAWIEKDIQCDDFDPDSVTCEKPARAADGWEWIPLYTTPPQRTWVEPTNGEWFNWWRVSPIADSTEAEIDFADFLIIAQAVMTKLKGHNK